MLFRGIKHQVDKGPVDWVTGKAKYTLNDNRLLREDLEYRTLVRVAEALAWEQLVESLRFRCVAPTTQRIPATSASPPSAFPAASLSYSSLLAVAQDVVQASRIHSDPSFHLVERTHIKRVAAQESLFQLTCVTSPFG